MRIRIGMPVRSGDGEKIGKVASISADGFWLGDDGPFAPYSDVIEIRDGEVWVATHRPELGERRQQA
jgi:hypothetical protein